MIWKTYKENYFRYDWIDDVVSEVNAPLTEYVVDSAYVNVTNKADTSAWNVDTENKTVALLGTSQESLFYYQYEYVPNIDMFLMELSVRKMEGNGKESYAIIDTSEWYASALEPFYFSSEAEFI